MHVLVVLGNRMNDDGTMTGLSVKRLNAAMRFAAAFGVDKIILSGGVANKKANRSEASAMHEYLLANGIAADRLVCEDKSLTTEENAKYSVPIAAKLGATEITVITSNEHMSRNFLNPIKLFEKELRNYPDIKLSAYSE